MGLVIFLVMGAYLLLSIFVVNRAITHAKKNNKSAKRWGWSAVLVMYLIPFWDWIPTVATHQYYCATEAGFWVYKTPEQWMQENPGVMETLVANRNLTSKREGDMINWTDTYFLNQRFIQRIKKTGPLFLNRWRWELELVDMKTNSVLSKSKDFSSGNGQIGGEPPYKFWLQSEGCFGGSAVNNAQFYAHKEHFIGSMQ